MPDKNKIRYMSRLAMYDSGQAEKDLRVMKYYRRDYAGLNTLITGVEITIGYLIIVGVYAVYNIDEILANLTMDKITAFVFTVVVIYLILIATYCVFGYNFYKKRHMEARKRIKNYYGRLSYLEKAQNKENK